MSLDRLRRERRELRAVLAGVRRELRDPAALVLLFGVVLAGGLWAASVYALPPNVQGSKVYEVLASALTTTLAVVFSVDYVVPYLKRTERRRIAGPDEVVARHDRSDDFLDLPSPRGGRFHGYVDAIPVTVEYLPESPTPVSDVPVRDDGGFYDFSDPVRATLEPHFDAFESLFRRERLHSELLSRVVRVDDDGTHVVERISYYRSFVTNFFPTSSCRRTRRRGTSSEASCSTPPGGPARWPIAPCRTTWAAAVSSSAPTVGRCSAGGAKGSPSRNGRSASRSAARSTFTSRP
jgi:hypothetical protein